MSFISSFQVIKGVVPELWIFFYIHESISEAGAVIAKRAKIFFARRTATFINEPANLLNNDPKNLPDWITLEMRTLESFMSV